MGKVTCPRLKAQGSRLIAQWFHLERMLVHHPYYTHLAARGYGRVGSAGIDLMHRTSQADLHLALPLVGAWNAQVYVAHLAHGVLYAESPIGLQLHHLFLD